VSGNVDSNTVSSYTLTYNVIDTSGNTAVAITRTANVVDTLGIDSVEDNYLKIYPIPTLNFLRVKQNTIIKNVQLYNIIGQIIYKTITNNKEIRINTSELKSGVYLVRISGGK